MDDWATIRCRYANEKIFKREVARQLVVSRGTVNRALATESAPSRHERPPAGSSFEGYVASVRSLLAKTPTMVATVIAERVDWPGSASLLRAKVAHLRPEHAPADRPEHKPGAAVQGDLWFRHAGIPLDRGQQDTPPVLVMTSTFSGFIRAWMLPTRTTEDLLGGMWALLQDAAAVPQRLVWDNETNTGMSGHRHTSCSLIAPARPWPQETVDVLGGGLPSRAFNQN